MLATRIIPCLDVHEDRVMKGVKFKDLKDAGDPVALARFYDREGADELVFLDIAATCKSRDTVLDMVNRVSGEVFIPLTVGGGIRSVGDMRRALNAGADKVAVCTAAIKDPMLIHKGAKQFGSQCIVLSIDAKRHGKKWHAWTHGGRFDSGVDAIAWAMVGQKLGAGEILLNSIDMDGTKRGYDLELTRLVSERVSIPVIASGGAGTLSQMADAVKKGRADALLLASLVHYRECRINDIKAYLKQEGVCVR